MKLRRTLLFVNGNDTEKLKKALNSNTDAIVLELEDGVPFSKKDEARLGAVKALKECDFGKKERVVRINPYSTELGRKDVNAILPALPDALRLTKCEQVEDILALDAEVSRFEREHELAHNSIEFILTLETPAGILNAYNFAVCTPRVTAIGLGAGDLTCSMDIDRELKKDSLQLLYVKQKLVLDGKAAGVQVIDTTVISQDNMDDFVEYDTSFIKNIGFTGRSVSDLSHIDIINRCFTPTARETETAEKIVKAYEHAESVGITDVFVDGNYIDVGVAEKSERLLNYSRLIAERLEG